MGVKPAALKKDAEKAQVKKVPKYVPTTPIGTRFPGMLGKKLGMTQIYDEDGVMHAVTIVKAGPCVVVQRKGKSSDGYAAIQIGLVDEKGAKRIRKPMAGHFKKHGTAATRVLREIRLPADDTLPALVAGAPLTVSTLERGDQLDVVGVSKGKGFQGVIRRHNFRGGAATHGSMFHRAPGSIGASAFPSRVFKGMRMGGHMGSDRTTVKNLLVLRLEQESNLVFLRGAVPGARNATVLLRPAQRQPGVK